jgi:hypothetical protein
MTETPSKKQIADQIQSLAVLVVDDNQYMRKMIRNLLVNCGIKDIYEANDGIAYSAFAETGLIRYSWAPSRTASTTRQRSPWPLSMMIGTSGIGNTPGARSFPVHRKML